LETGTVFILLFKKLSNPLFKNQQRKLNPNLVPNFSRATTMKDDEFAKFFGLAGTENTLNSINAPSTLNNLAKESVER
jgi:hypothetical protein